MDPSYNIPPRLKLCYITISTDKLCLISAMILCIYTIACCPEAGYNLKNKRQSRYLWLVSHFKVFSEFWFCFFFVIYEIWNWIFTANEKILIDSGEEFHYSVLTGLAVLMLKTMTKMWNLLVLFIYYKKFLSSTGKKHSFLYPPSSFPLFPFLFISFSPNYLFWQLFF